MNIIDTLLFIVLPYLAIAVFVIGTISRYTSTRFKFSSLSSQFLEGKNLFWGSVPFHWGILFLFFGHLIAFLIPGSVIAFNSDPLRLYILEITAFIFGLCVLVGLINLVYRRLTRTRLLVVTNYMDVIIEILLLAQVVTGLWVALEFRWGSSWFASDLTPYLWSIFSLQPDILAVSALPWLIKFHIAGAFIFVLLIPFTRMVHFLVAPVNYIWRPYQLVMWNWRRKKIRMPESGWMVNKPKNN